jgi:hypothetical protein
MLTRQAAAALDRYMTGGNPHKESWVVRCLDCRWLWLQDVVVEYGACASDILCPRCESERIDMDPTGEF